MRKTHLREYLDKKKKIVITACGMRVAKTREMTDDHGKVTCARCQNHVTIAKG